MYIQLLFET